MKITKLWTVNTLPKVFNVNIEYENMFIPNQNKVNGW